MTSHLALDDPATFAIKAGYTANLQPDYFSDDRADGVTWQPDLYPLVADLSRALGCRQIIDVGCGQAGKLHPFSPEFDIVGLDYGANLALCRERYPRGRWVDVDLERPSLPARASDGWMLRPSGIVCGDVIEHLMDPRPLLELLRALLATSPFVAISTPDRDLRRGVDHMGPPLNPCHVREWTVAELAAFCRERGLDVAWTGMTTAHTAAPDDRTTALAIVVAPGTAETTRAVIGATAGKTCTPVASKPSSEPL